MVTWRILLWLHNHGKATSKSFSLFKIDMLLRCMARMNLVEVILSFATAKLVSINAYSLSPMFG